MSKRGKAKIVKNNRGEWVAVDAIGMPLTVPRPSWIRARLALRRQRKMGRRHEA